MSGQRIVINMAVATFAFLEAFGVSLVYFGWIVPHLLIARSATWVPVPCTVIATGGDSESGYEHLFDYTIGGKTYRSSRVTFWGDSPNFRYLDGGRVTGRVDPARPEEAFLCPDWRPPGILIEVVLIAWLTIATGGLGYYLAIRLNMLPIAMDVGSERKSYYREM